MEQTYMKEQPVLGLMLRMSLPMVISMMVNSLYNIVDSFFVAQISEDAMTALSLVYPVQNLVNAVTIGFGIGINAVIAFHLGAQEQQKADAAAAQGLVLNVLHGIVLTVGCILVMPAFLRLFTTDESVVSMGLAYSNIVFGFSVIIALGLAFEKIFQAVGKMAVSMAAMLAGCICNIILDPVLIFGIGPFPEMGIRGAALATGLGQVLTLAVYLVYYFRGALLPVRISLRGFSFQKEMCLRLYGIGIPAILNLALPSLLISSLNAILAGYSQAYVLVLGVYYKLQTFLYLPRERHRAGHAAADRLQLRGWRAQKSAFHLPDHARPRGGHHACGNRALSCRSRSADGTFHRKCFHGSDRRSGAADHLHRFSALRRFRSLFRRAGGAWKGRALPADLPVPVSDPHHPHCLRPQPAPWRRGRVARVLDYGVLSPRRSPWRSTASA